MRAYLSTGVEPITGYGELAVAILRITEAAQVRLTRTPACDIVDTCS